MTLRVSTNTTSLAALNRSRNLNTELQDNTEKLASGYRITKAGHDPAGLAISESMKSKIRSTGRAIRNSNDAVSFVQTAEGSLNEVSSFAVRMKELAVQAASDTVGDGQREMIDLEIQGLKTEIRRIANQSNFNDIKFFDGKGGILEFQIGTGQNAAENRMLIDRSKLDLTLKNIGIEDKNVRSKDSAREMMESMTQFIETLGQRRTYLGTLQSRLIKTSSNLEVSKINGSAANSRIRDLDVAAGTADNVRLRIRSDATTASLAQSNNINNGVLKLLS